jgi:hypothetical protein
MEILKKACSMLHVFGIDGLFAEAEWVWGGLFSEGRFARTKVNGALAEAPACSFTPAVAISTSSVGIGEL